MKKLGIMNKIYRVFVCLTAIFQFTSSAQLFDVEKLSAEEQIAVYLHNAPYDDMLVKLRSMSAVEKAKALTAIKKNESGIWENGHPHVLVYLGDAVERKKAIEGFRRIRFYNPELVKLGEPWVIETLAPEMFREEEFTNLVQGDILNYPLSHGVAGLIIANLQNATIYSNEVQQWARRTSPHALPQLRPAMRDWWRENERFFKEKNYKAVRPGRDVPVEDGSVAAPPLPPEPPENRVVPHPGNPPATSPAQARAPDSKDLAPTAPRRSIHEPATPSVARLITIALLALAALFGLLVVVRKRR